MRRKAVSVTRSAMRSLVSISCAVISTACGRRSRRLTSILPPAVQNACRPGASRLVQLDAKLVPRVEQSVAARLEHALVAAVAQKEGTLAILHSHARDEQVTVHGTSPSVGRGLSPAAGLRERGLGPGHVLPAGTTGHGLSSRWRRAHALIRR